MLKNKKILISITGSIAAYKIISLVRLLVKADAQVKVLMTPSAKNFVSPLVLSTLSKNEVLVDLESNNSWANHVKLGRWADIMVVAPASCNTIAKMANGICDNLLMAVYLSATCPVCIAPAMDEDMWLHPATQKNLKTIESFGNKIINVNEGELASGLFGYGRMAEPEEIIKFLIVQYFRNNELKNKNILITAGPTYEYIDPVRFIGNFSSGKMGFNIAEQCFLKGANVTIITGYTNCRAEFKNINVINVTTSNQMLKAVEDNLNDSDIIIMAAAVADYKPANVASQKIKKSENRFTLELEKTEDILKKVGNEKKDNQFIVGFALETNNEKENAIKKLTTKNLDAIVLNSLNPNNQVFDSDYNCITIIDKEQKEHNFERKLKQQVAKDIVDFIIRKTN